MRGEKPIRDTTRLPAQPVHAYRYPVRPLPPDYELEAVPPSAPAAEGKMSTRDWVSLGIQAAAVAAGIVLCCTGQVAFGAPLIVTALAGGAKGNLIGDGLGWVLKRPGGLPWGTR